MSNTNTTETMAQRLDRLFANEPLAVALEAAIADWKSGNMTLSRMERIIDGLWYFRKSKAFLRHIGKLERVGRFGKGNGVSYDMGKVTPNEITRYLEACLDWLRIMGDDDMTASQFAEWVQTSSKA